MVKPSWMLWWGGFWRRGERALRIADLGWDGEGKGSWVEARGRLGKDGEVPWAGYGCMTMPVCGRGTAEAKPIWGACDDGVGLR